MRTYFQNHLESYTDAIGTQKSVSRTHRGFAEPYNSAELRAYRVHTSPLLAFAIGCQDHEEYCHLLQREREPSSQDISRYREEVPPHVHAGVKGKGHPYAVPLHEGPGENQCPAKDQHEDA